MPHPIPERRSGSRARLARWLQAAAVLALSLGFAAGDLRADEETPDELQVHAAYLVNFVRYSRWPDRSNDGARTIAVVGPAEVAAEIERLARRAGPVDGHRIAVRRLPFQSAAPESRTAIAALRRATIDADVVFVAASHRAWQRPLVTAVAGRPVLTVGTGPDFVADGGMLAMFDDRGRVRIAANIDAIRQSGVDVSARVLLLARRLSGRQD